MANLPYQLSFYIYVRLVFVLNTLVLTSTAIFWCCLEQRVPLTIEPNDYVIKSAAGSTIKLYVKGKVTETGQAFVTQKDVELTKPKLTITVSQFDDNNFHLVVMHNSKHRLLRPVSDTSNMCRT